MGSLQSYRFGAFDRLRVQVHFAYRWCLSDALSGLVRRQPELFRDGHLVDAGAGVGYSSVVLARAVADGFRVFAREPDPTRLNLLRAVLDTSTRGVVELVDGMPTVDRLLAVRAAATPVAAIRVDAGAQALALCKGAEFTLAGNPNCAVILEYRPKALSSAGVEKGELLGWFARRGYRVHKVGRTGQLSVVKGEIGRGCLLFRRG